MEFKLRRISDLSTLAHFCLQIFHYFLCSTIKKIHFPNIVYYIIFRKWNCLPNLEIYCCFPCILFADKIHQNCQLSTWSAKMSPRATVPSSIVLNKGGPEIFSGKYNACTQRQIGMYYSVSEAKMIISIWVWQKYICKLGLIWRWFQNPEIW